MIPLGGFGGLRRLLAGASEATSIRKSPGCQSTESSAILCPMRGSAAGASEPLSSAVLSDLTGEYGIDSTSQVSVQAWRAIGFSALAVR